MAERVEFEMDDETARWAQRQAAARGISVAEFLASVVTDRAYRDAFEKFKSIPPAPGLAGDRLRRDDIYGQGR